MKRNILSPILITAMLISGCAPQTEATTTLSETTVTTAAQTEATTVLETEPEPTEEVYVYDVYEGSERANEILAGMTLRDKICQMIMVSPEQITGTEIPYYDTEFGDISRNAIANYPVGGIVLFGGNIIDPDQVTSYIQGYQDASEIDLFIAIDEEGGDITRIASNEAFDVEAFSPMREIGNTGDPSQAYHVGNTIGTYLLEYGFNLDFAPVSDVDSNPDNTVIGDRAFSDDPAAVAQMVTECVTGLHDAGVMCTLKHFPGHGDTVADTHFETASIDRSMDEIRACELIPFASGIEAGADFIMTAHITTPLVDTTGLPASLSHYWLTDILRNEMGFEGIIITDSMIMQAITDEFTSDQAAVMAVYAGADIILMPEDIDLAIEGLTEAVENGSIPVERIDSSVLRILDKKIEYGLI